MVIKNLFFGGGGLNGISLLGALCVADKKIINFKDISQVCGTSIGSIIGFLYIYGYSPRALFDLILDLDFKKLCSVSILSLMSKKGMDDGNKMYSWLENLLEGEDKGITFEKLYKKSGKIFYVTATNVMTHKLEIFSYKTHPDMSVLLAVRMSISVPFIFTPVEYKGNLYIDGGVIGVSPLYIFEDSKKETIVFIVCDKSNNIIKQNTGTKTAADDKLSAIYQYSYNVLRCLIKTNPVDKIFNIIKINCENSEFINYSMSASKKLKLFNSGNEQCEIILNSEEFKAKMNED
jgi:NTE family protein